MLALKSADEVIWSPDALQDLRYEYPLADGGGGDRPGRRADPRMDLAIG